VLLTADASDTDGTIARVEFFNGNTLLGEATSAPFSFTWQYVPAGNHTLTARATDDVGASTESAPVHIVVGHDSVLPAAWHAGDIGAVAAGGMTTYADGAYTLTASGAGITSLKDEFHFLSQPWTGDGEIIAHIASVDALNVKSFGGIMFREKAATSSRFALLKVTAGQGAIFQYRSNIKLPVAQRAPLVVTAPRWLRLVRHGLRCTAYTSADGVQWQQLGTAALPMASALSVGLAASSALDGQTANAIFDHVTVRTLTSPAPPTVTITSPADSAAFTTPVTIAIDARANDPDGGIARVELYSGTKKLAIDTLAPFAFVWPGVKAGTYSLTARAFDFAGLKTTSTPVTINVATVASALTAPWLSFDMGATRQPGAAAENAGATTLMSVGPGLGSKSDQGRFVYRQFSGDGTLIAHLASLADTAPGAQAGITFRESLGTTARNVTLMVTNEQGAFLRSRATVGAASTMLAKPDVTAPQWLKLVRRGAVVSAFVSPDGTTWTSVGKRSVAMAAKGYVALFVGAADPTEEATAVFDNISVTHP
jgi:regulation of enolase protein 1 (concanavalin A-like superfamily)